MAGHKWDEFLEQKLITATGYSGNKKSGVKSISGSMVNSDLLPLYLDFKHGKQEDTEFQASNLGSVFHLGAEHIF